MLPAKGFLLVCALSACAPAVAHPAWSRPALDDLEAVANAAPFEGLPPENAALGELARFRQSGDTDPIAAAQIDIAADALFASLARAFAQGATDPARADPDWTIPLASAPDLVTLQNQRAAGAASSTLLRPLLPHAREYALLRDELARLRSEPESSDRNARITQVRANLERWRWLPRQMPDRRLEVRIPFYELRVDDAGSAETVTHKVIVGARGNQTPSLADEIRSITFNPSWEPPAGIAAELLRRFRRDPSAAAREGFDALDAQGAVIAPDTVDWSAQPFPYRLRQRPGPDNALGRIRFDMANRFAIRLHDTPNRNLFARDSRALSHGCIRVQDTETLAAYLLAPQNWSAAAIETAIDMGTQQTVALHAPMPIYLVYLTTSADQDGQILYAEDIYGRDGAVVAALDAEDVVLARQAATAPSCATDAPMP